MNMAFLARAPAIALSGALAFAVPCLAQPATGSTTSQGVNMPNSTATGTTSGPAAGTPVEHSMPATRHQAKVLKKHAKTRKMQPASADAKHVKGSRDTESGTAPKTQ